MRGIVTLAAGAILLAACGSGDADADGDGTISMEEAVAKSGEEMIKSQPGLYRSTVELVEFDMPDAPAQLRDMVRQQIGAGGQQTEYCLTPEDADKGFEEMARQAGQDDSCSFEKFEANSGTIDAVMVCDVPGQLKSRTEISGTGTATSSDMTMKMEGTAPGGQAISMTTRMKQERIGDC